MTKLKLTELIIDSFDFPATTNHGMQNTEREKKIEKIFIELGQQDDFHINKEKILNDHGVHVFQKNGCIVGWITEKEKQEIINGEYQMVDIPLSCSSQEPKSGDFPKEKLKVATIRAIQKLTQRINFNFSDDIKNIPLIIRIISLDQSFLNLPWEWIFDENYLKKEIYIQRSSKKKSYDAKWENCNLQFASSEAYTQCITRVATPIDKRDFSKIIIEGPLVNLLYEFRSSNAVFANINFMGKLTRQSLEESIYFFDALHINCHGTNKHLSFEKEDNAINIDSVGSTDLIELLKKAVKLHFLFIYACKSAEINDSGQSLASSIFNLFPGEIELIAMQFPIGSPNKKQDVTIIKEFYLSLMGNKSTFSAFRDMLSYMRKVDDSMIFSPVFYSNYNYKI